jgi:hypothetical protein
LAAFSIGCSGIGDIAGSKGGSETTNGITACILNQDGTPSEGSVVRVRRSDYVSRPESTCQERDECTDVVTDTDGSFRVVGMVPGSYSIEINDTVTGDRLGGALLLRCTVGETDTINFGEQSLRSHARISGKVDRTGYGSEELIVQIRGLERVTFVDQDESFHFDDLPGGKVDIRVVNRSDETDAREIRDITASPGDTVSVQVSGTSAWSQYIYMDTLVADMADTVVLTGFPLLVRLDKGAFDFSQSRSGGEDIRFKKTNGSSFPFEIEQWDGGAQRASVWVRIDTVYGGKSDQAVVMQWGDPDAESLSDGAAVFEAPERYAGVWHLDSLSGSEGTMETVSGVIGSALSFDGNGDQILLEALNVSGDYTLSCWVNFADLSYSQRIIWKEYSYTLWYDQGIEGLRVEHYTDSLVWRGIYQDNFRSVPVAADIWYYIVGTYDANKIRLYINGEVVDSTEIIADDPYSSTEPLSLGGRSGEFFKGILDEVRIEDVKHSPEWIRLCYRNQRRDILP